MAFDPMSFVIGQQTEKSGGSSGGGGSFRYNKKSFKATATQETIYHGLSEVPDIIFVALDGVPNNYNTYYSVGFSQAMIDKMGGGYCNSVKVVGPTGAIGGTGNVGIENDFAGTTYANYGGIRNCNDSTFTIGGTTGKLMVDKYYTCIAISGIV